MRLQFRVSVSVFVFVLLGLLPPFTAGAQFKTLKSIFDFSWLPAESIQPPRYYHTSSLLDNGNVLVTGGRNYVAPLRSNSLFDSDANGGRGQWLPVPDMKERRERHSATKLYMGHVLVAGGIQDKPTKAAELYNPVSNTWEVLPDMFEARYEHTATLLPGNKVLVTGSKNYDLGLSACEIFEPLETVTSSGSSSMSIWRWKRTGSLKYARGNHTATRLQDGRVLVTGGVHLYSRIRYCEIWNPITQTWTDAPDMMFPRDAHTATLLPDGRVLVIGGNGTNRKLASCEVFDPTADAGFGKWSMVNSMQRARMNHTATLLGDQHILVTGAWVVGNGDLECEIMDITQLPTAVWQPAPLMLDYRSNHTATILKDGRLLLVGGETGGMQGATSSCDITDRTLGLNLTQPVPISMTLSQNHPNPFAESTLVPLELSTRCVIIVSIFNATGQEVYRFPKTEYPAGNHLIHWDGCQQNGRNVVPGIYFLAVSNSRSFKTIPMLYSP